jgi:signal transduction histidine kinase/CheY-like chemotaxis protein
MGMKAKILVPVIIITFAGALGILVSNIALFSGFVDTSTVKQVDATMNVVTHSLETIKAEVEAMSLNIANDHALIGAMAANTRGELLARLMALKGEMGFDFCTVTDAGGTVLARTHAPERYGDSAVSQANIRAAMRGERLTAVEEGSIIRLSVRAGTPVIDGSGALVGVVSLGYRLDTNHFVDIHKKMTDCEVNITLGSERVATTIVREDGSRAVGTKADPEIAETVLGGNSYSGRAIILGQTAVAKYIPIDGPDGHPIGMIFVGQYLEEESKTILAFVRGAALITAIMLAISIALFLTVVERIVRPIRAMTKTASALAVGDTDLEVRVYGHDETRALAEAFNSMITNTRRQIETVEHIAAGDLSLTLAPRSEKDSINRALEKLNATIKAQAVEIRAEHERVKVLLDATPMASRLWSKDCEMIDCNEEAVRLFGFKTKREYLEHHFELSPDYQADGQSTREKVVSLVRETFEKGVCRYYWNYRLMDGTELPCEVTMVRVPYGSDYVVAAYSRDMREQKSMMAAIEQRDSLLQTVNQAAETLFRSEPDNFSTDLRHCMGMMADAVGADRMFVWRNYAEGEKLMASQVHEWHGDAFAFPASGPGSNISYDDTFPEFKAAYLRGECVNTRAQDTLPAARADFEANGILSILALPIFIREEFWGVVTFDNLHSEEVFATNAESVMRSGSLLIVNAILRNEYMLQIRDTSAQLETALVDTKAANSAKSAFLAHMSHEIRTPLNAVVGLSGLALDGGGELSDEMRNRLEAIHGSGQTILHIINDILDISKIESGKFELFNSKYDTPSLINDLVTLNMVRIGEKPISFRLDIDENLPGKLFGDELRVKQIFSNLLSNAFKYTDSGTVEWRVRHEREGDSIWLLSSIRDTGIGIRPEALKTIFSDYNQADLANNRKIEGTGLGLPISKRLLEMMDGNITVESEYRKGTAFHVRFRQAFAGDAPIGAEVAKNLTGLRYMLAARNGSKILTHTNLSYAHVLVVDDISTNIDVVTGMMKPYGVKIDCTNSGYQAIDMIRAEKPRYSAIFMDHMMPGIDGIEATRIIREEIGTDYARNVPIIALTANAIVGNREMFLSRGFQDFISKPIDTARLDSVLRRWVRNRELEKELLAATEADDGPGGTDTAFLDGLNIEGLDVRGALSRFNNDEAIFIDVLRSYVSVTRSLLGELGNNLDAGDLEAYCITVHGIKGSSYGIFAWKIGAKAEELENAARAGDIEKVKITQPIFEETMKKLIESIEQALAQIEARTRKPAASAPDPALLRELREACKAFNMDRVDAAMAKLESFRYDHGSELVAWLRQKVHEMAFEEISAGEKIWQ